MVLSRLLIMADPSIITRIYYYAEDEGEDTPQGQSIAGAWFLVTPAGDRIDTRAEGAADEGMTPEATEEAAEEG